jgi:DNA-binding IclR family transcriptional regulator
MERLSAEFRAQCIASTLVRREIVISASAGLAQRGSPITLVGQRWPFTPPAGAVFAAWSSTEETEAWLRRGGGEPKADVWRAKLPKIRQRGFSIGVRNAAHQSLLAQFEAASSGRTEVRSDTQPNVEQLDFDPLELTKEICKRIWIVSVPAAARSGEVVLALSLTGFTMPYSCEIIHTYASRLTSVASELGSLVD